MSSARARQYIIRLAREGLGTVKDFMRMPHPALLWWWQGLQPILKAETDAKNAAAQHPAPNRRTARR